MRLETGDQIIQFQILTIMAYVYPSAMRDSGYSSNSENERVYYTDEELPEDVALEWMGVGQDGATSSSSVSTSPSSSSSSAPSSPEWVLTSDEVDSEDSVSGE
jgi:hypothetical protein